MSNTLPALKAQLTSFFHQRWTVVARHYQQPAENYHDLCCEVSEEAKRLFSAEFAPLAHRIVLATGPEKYPLDLPKPPEMAILRRSWRDELETVFGTDQLVEAARRCLRWGAVLHDRRAHHASRATERAILNWASWLVIDDQHGTLRTFGQAIEVVVDSFDVLAGQVESASDHLVTREQIARCLLMSVRTLRNLMSQAAGGASGRVPPAPAIEGNGRGKRHHFHYGEYREWLLSVRPHYEPYLPGEFRDFLAKIQDVQP